MRRLALIALFVSTLANAEGSAFEVYPEATVKACHDGDTCTVVRALDGVEIKLRLAGIDAPEISGGPGGEGQPMAREARDLLVRLLKGRTIVYRPITQDPYGRTVAEIVADGEVVNRILLNAGLAEFYRAADPKIDKKLYESIETRAKAAKKGVWSLETYESPAHFRKANKP